MNWHEVIDERSYEMDQVIAEELRCDPGKLHRVVLWIQRFLDDPDYSVHAKQGLQEWLDLIRKGGVPMVIQKLEERSEDATRMRQNSPFGIIMPQEERVRILNKYETLRPRAHPAGV